MKLAEALQERADLNRMIESLRVRLMNNALVQEGEEPAEDPVLLKRELDASIERLQELMRRINLTNCETQVDGESLTGIIAKKDSLLLKVSVYRDMVDAASRTVSRARNTEIRIISTLPVSELQATADELAKEIRLLDNKLQEWNWKTELL